LLSERNTAGWNYKVKEHTIVLGYVFLCLPLFDMLTGILVVRGFLQEGALASPSQIGRLLATPILLFYAYRSRLSGFWIIFLLILLMVEMFSGFRTNDVNGVLFGVITSYRFIYIYLLFVVLVKSLEYDIGIVGKFLKYNLNFISASIIFGYVTGLGNSTYGWGAGTKGFFASGNGLGIYVGVAAIFLIAMKRYKIHKNISFITILLAFISLLLIGSKTALLLAVIILFLVAWVSRFAVIFLAVVTFVIFYFQTEIMETLGVLFDVIFMRYSNSLSMIEFLASGRIEYITSAFSTLSEQNVGLFRWLFGGGSYLSFQNPSAIVSYDTLETDPFDILFMYGFFGLFGYFLLLFIGVRLFRKYPYMLLGFVLLFTHSIFAGHVLFNGMSTTLLVVLMSVGVVLGKTRLEEP